MLSTNNTARGANVGFEFGAANNEVDDTVDSEAQQPQSGKNKKKSTTSGKKTKDGDKEKFWTPMKIGAIVGVVVVIIIIIIVVATTTGGDDEPDKPVM